MLKPIANLQDRADVDADPGTPLRKMGTFVCEQGPKLAEIQGIDQPQTDHHFAFGCNEIRRLRLDVGVGAMVHVNMNGTRRAAIARQIFSMK